MSRQFDAKQSVLAAYPDNREAGIQLFQDIMNCSESDFEYEEGVGFEEYIYGGESDVKEWREKNDS